MAEETSATKEEVTKLKHAFFKKKEIIRKAESRRKLPWESQAGWEFCFCCALVFDMETTKYTASLALLIQKDKSRKAVWTANTPEKSKDLVDKVVGKAKANLEKWEQNAKNFKHPAHWKAQEFLIQYNLAKSLQELNCKGVSVPSSVLMQNYIDAWGPQPWTEHTSAHLSRLAEAKKAKKWRNSFRARWNFKYAKMNEQTPLQEDDVAKKVAS